MSTRILILGATSAIAQAYARRRAAQRCRFILAGRDDERLAAIAADLKERGAAMVESITIDLAALDRIEQTACALRAQFGEPDEILIAHGMLVEQATAERDLAQSRALIDTNFTSAVLWILALLKDRGVTTRCTVVGIGSVAGDRGRASNFIYGSSKAAFDVFLQGLRHGYDGTPVRIVTVKPGLIDTPMTASMMKGGPLWATSDQVAADIERAVNRGKRVIYSPRYWGVIMTVIRCLPWFVFRRLKI